MGILAAFILALVVLILFLYPTGYKRKNLSLIPVVLFFIILFMAGIASQYWITPFGPAMWGVYWLPLLFIVLVFAFLLFAPSLDYYGNIKIKESDKTEPFAISIFIWLLLLFLLLAIITGFF